MIMSCNNKHMKHTNFAIILALAIYPCSRADERDNHFESRIRPLLVKHCIGCHGPEKQKGGLRLDDKSGWTKGGDTGPALLPGKPDSSALMHAVKRDGSVAAMPPKQVLSPAEIQALERWILDGAHDPRNQVASLGGMSVEGAKRWWSFQPVGKPTPPENGHPVDAFLKAKLKAKGMAFQKTSTPHDLLRRVTYDLTGLPPTAEEMEAYLADTTPNAYGKAVDRLLASNAYGERWGRHWLDLARYADTAGENTDHPLPHAWRYRNWVIDSFNSDMPFDQFVKAQVAGDLLAEKAPEKDKAGLIVATGFLAVARRFDHDTDKHMHLTFEDAIDTLGRTFMGMSLGCARCHDHKYDPITTSDYYSLYGILESTRFPFPGCEAKMQPRDMVILPGNEQQVAESRRIDSRISQIDAEKARLKQPIIHLKDGKLLTRGTVADGSNQALTVESPVTLKPGEMLLLAISPLTNHGADSTRVELKIKATDPAQPSWDLKNDTIDILHSGNPVGVRKGQPRVWHFFDLQKDAKLLSKSLVNILGKPGLNGWQSEADTPSVMVNSTPSEIKAFTSLPARTFFAHPSPNGAVGIGFLAPVACQVNVSGVIADAHPGGTDGVAYTLTLVPASATENLPALSEQRELVSRLEAERAQLLAKRPNPDLAFAVAEGKPADAAIQIRGEPEKKGPVVPRGMPTLLAGTTVPPGVGSGRLELAQWLASPNHPLTARVMVNRVWQYHFGNGIVRTSSDFGARGLPPTHPELLDWLARYFIDDNFSLKRLHKLIVTSAAYQQGNGPIDDRDPDNQLLGRFARRRLSAEEIRDSLLRISGVLDRSAGTQHPFPPENTWGFTQHNPFAAVYDNNQRTVYQMVTRNRRHPFLALFDGADPNTTTPDRQATTVPTQALFFMNDPFFHASALKLAQRASEAADVNAQIDKLYSLSLQRLPLDAERSIVLQLAPTGATRLDAASLAPVARVVLTSNAFLSVD